MGHNGGQLRFRGSRAGFCVRDEHGALEITRGAEARSGETFGCSTVQIGRPLARSLERGYPCRAPRRLRSSHTTRDSMQDDVRNRIDDLVKNNRVMLFMKGNKVFPSCGFSAQVVQILKHHGTEFETFNVLSDPAMRAGIKEYSDWPTIPQLYVGGEFIGGCDIVTDMHNSGELQKLLAG
jgi:monothiol glutaredoxin